MTEAQQTFQAVDGAARRNRIAERDAIYEFVNSLGGKAVTVEERIINETVATILDFIEKRAKQDREFNGKAEDEETLENQR